MILNDITIGRNLTKARELREPLMNEDVEVEVGGIGGIQKSSGTGFKENGYCISLLMETSAPLLITSEGDASILSLIGQTRKKEEMLIIDNNDEQKVYLTSKKLDK